MNGKTPGQAVYEAYAARITDLRAQYAGTDFPSAAPQPWDRLPDTFRDGWEAGAGAAWDRARADVIAEARRHAADAREAREQLDSCAGLLGFAAQDASDLRDLVAEILGTLNTASCEGLHPARIHPQQLAEWRKRAGIGDGR